MSVSVQSEPLVLGPQQNGIRMTPEEFDAVEEWDETAVYELVRGVLIVNPPPLEQERDPNEELGYWLRRFKDDHPQGGVLDATLPEQTVRTAESRRRADRVIWTGLGRRPDPRQDVPAIVVEFVSEGRRNWQRDYLDKRDEYLAAGVQEYWVIDRFRRRMTVYRKAGEGAEQQVVEDNQTYRPALLPGFELPLSRLLECADRWNQA